MCYLVGCVFAPRDGWRVKECVRAADNLAERDVSTSNGVLWVKSATPVNPGRFVNPKKLVGRKH